MAPRRALVAWREIWTLPQYGHERLFVLAVGLMLCIVVGVNVWMAWFLNRNDVRIRQSQEKIILLQSRVILNKDRMKALDDRQDAMNAHMKSLDTSVDAIRKLIQPAPVRVGRKARGGSH